MDGVETWSERRRMRLYHITFGHAAELRYILINTKLELAPPNPGALR